MSALVLRERRRRTESGLSATGDVLFQVAEGGLHGVAQRGAETTDLDAAEGQDHAVLAADLGALIGPLGHVVGPRLAADDGRRVHGARSLIAARLMAWPAASSARRRAISRAPTG